MKPTFATTTAAAFLASTASVAASDLVSSIVLRTGEVAVVDYTLKNPTLTAATILTWDTPLEDTVRHPLFDFSKSNATVEYTGIMMKRANEIDPSIDLVTLQPGQSITTTIDLNDYYIFDSDGEFTAEANFDLREVPSVRMKSSFRQATPTFRSLNPEMVRSNPVSFKIGGTKSKAVRRAEEAVQPRDIVATAAGAGGVTPQLSSSPTSTSPSTEPAEYVGCSASQQSVLISAIAGARTMLKNSNAVLTANSETSYTKWFENTGLVTASRYTTVKKGHVALDAAFDGSYKVDCSTCKSNAYAYVYPSDLGKTIYLCPVFWDFAPAQTYIFDSQPGTMIHEMAHFIAVWGTQDYQYGTAGALALAKSDPSKAVLNSDSVEFFNEDKAQ